MFAIRHIIPRNEHLKVGLPKVLQVKGAEQGKFEPDGEVARALTAVQRNEAVEDSGCFGSSDLEI